MSSPVCASTLTLSASDAVRPAWSRALLDDAKAQILALVDDFHQDRPLLRDLPTSNFHELDRFHQQLAEDALQELVDDELIVEGALAGRPDFDPMEAPAGATLRTLAHLFSAGNITPTDEEVIAQESLSDDTWRDAVTELKRRQNSFDSPLNTILRPIALDELHAKLVRHFAQSDELSTADFKTLAGGVSRKFAIPLLEFSDKSHGPPCRRHATGRAQATENQMQQPSRSPRWTGRTALVTGASDGIGRDMARALVNAGLQVLRARVGSSPSTRSETARRRRPWNPPRPQRRSARRACALALFEEFARRQGASTS